MTQLTRYLPDGEVRTIYRDGGLIPPTEVVPERGSHVLPVKNGPNTGKFHVDFSPLSDVTGREDHRICLAALFDTYQGAVNAEVVWLNNNFVKEGLNAS